MTRERGATYQIEGIPPEVLHRAKARAALEGHSLRAVLFRALTEYAAGLGTTPAFVGETANASPNFDNPDHDPFRSYLASPPTSAPEAAAPPQPIENDGATPRPPTSPKQPSSQSAVPSSVVTIPVDPDLGF